ncbi:MAG TPA: SDR family oxidoreductase [Pyrinomonadaceae bacterium]|nr:SDR family oxidoreductase [Pyrinomonadaceae bacterium]
MKLKKLEDQVVVITGATSGIGLVTARMAAKRGAKLVLVARTESALEDLTAELKAAGADAAYVKADVGIERDVLNVRDAACIEFGGFDTWVNNAAVSIYGKVTDVPIEDHRRLFETNYWGVVYGSIVAADHLASKGGAIINIGSTLSDRAIPIQGTYCASKHAIKGFTDALRMELEHDKSPVSVTLIKPAAINTPYTMHAKNFLPTEPEVPAPVYAPETVAETILYAAQNPVRDLYVGAAAKALSMAGYYAPGLTDKYMERTMFESDQREVHSSEQHNGLNRPSGELKETGDYDGHVAKTSLYTKALLHPRITAGSFAFLATALGYALLRRSATH